MKRSGKKGFTLLEIMVAISILSISFITLMNFSGNTLRVSLRAENLTIATMLARQKMTDVEIELHKKMQRNEFPDEKTENGRFDEPYEDFSWSMEVRKVDLPAPVTGEGGGLQDVLAKQLTKEIARTVRELKVIIKWVEGEDEQVVDVVTHIVKL